MSTEMSDHVIESTAVFEKIEIMTPSVKKSYKASVIQYLVTAYASMFVDKCIFVNERRDWCCNRIIHKVSYKTQIFSLDLSSFLLRQVYTGNVGSRFLGSLAPKD